MVSPSRFLWPPVYGRRPFRPTGAATLFRPPGILISCEPTLVLRDRRARHPARPRAPRRSGGVRAAVPLVRAAGVHPGAAPVRRPRGGPGRAAGHHAQAASTGSATSAATSPVLGLAAADRGQRGADASAQARPPAGRRGRGRGRPGVRTTRCCHRPPPMPPCCGRALGGCRTPPAACCGSTTPRATPTTRSPTAMQRRLSFSKSQLARGTRKLRAMLQIDTEVNSHA